MEKKKRTLMLYLTPHTKFNLRQRIDLSVKPEIIKISEQNMEEYLQAGKDFLHVQSNSHQKNQKPTLINWIS